MDIGDLVAKMRLDSSGIDGGAEHAKHGLRGLSSEVKHIGMELAGAFGVGFSIDKFVEGIHGQVEAIDKLSHTSEKLDVPINSLIALQHEAKMVDVTFESLETGMLKMSGSIADAQDGLEEQALAFRKLGVDLSSFSHLGAGEQFAQLAESISHLDNVTDRVQITKKIFGRGGAELLPMLMKGAKGAEEARIEAEKLGLTIDGLGAGKLSELDDAMKSLDEATQGLYRSFAVQLAPSIVSATNALTDFIAHKDGLNAGGVRQDTSGMDVLRSAGRGAWDLTKGAFGGMMFGLAKGVGAGGVADSYKGMLDDAQHDLNAMYDEFSGKQLSPDKFNGSQQQIEAERRKSNATLAEKEKREAAMQKEFESAEAQAEQFNNKFRTPMEAAQEEFQKIENLADQGFNIHPETLQAAFDKVGQAAREAREKELKPFLDELDKLDSDAAGLIEETRTPIEKFGDEIERINELFDAGAIDEKTWGRGMANAQDKFDSSKEKRGPDPANHALLKGSREALAAVFTANRESAADPGQQTANNTAAMVRQLQELTAENRKLREGAEENGGGAFDIGPG